MDVFYINDGELLQWNESLLENGISKVEIGDPLTVEYKRIHIKSNRFDAIGKSEVMIVNHIRNQQTKERSMESITYYDDDATTRGDSYFGNKVWSVGPFDSSEYGNPVCFHTPGYQGTVLSITTKMWEIDDPILLKKGLEILSSVVGVIKSAHPVLEIANTGLGFSTKIIRGYIGHSELAPEHTLELRLDSDKPLIPGKFICIPNLETINQKYNILNNYFVEDNMLIKKNDGNYTEYGGTYFIIHVDNEERKDLEDFDFTASSADILKMIQNDNMQEIQKTLLEINRDSYDLKIIELIKTKYDDWIASEEDKGSDIYKEVIALYKQLGLSKKKEWFDDSFPEISSDLN